MNTTVEFSRRAVQSISPALKNSPLMKAGGFDVFEGLPVRSVCAQLLNEALAVVTTARPSQIPFSDNEEIRGGKPARRFLSATGAPIQTAFYRNTEVLRFLTALCNAPVRPSGGTGTYTFYARAGDHLALHRDIRTCDLAVITCLLDRHHAESSGGFTILYPERQSEPLSAIRASPSTGAVQSRIRPGQTMVMLGGLVPHLITPIEAGELRIVSLLCYEVRPDMIA